LVKLLLPLIAPAVDAAALLAAIDGHARVAAAAWASFALLQSAFVGWALWLDGERATGALGVPVQQLLLRWLRAGALAAALIGALARHPVRWRIPQVQDGPEWRDDPGLGRLAA
jgi:hypothetical protein